MAALGAPAGARPRCVTADAAATCPRCQTPAPCRLHVLGAHAQRGALRRARAAAGWRHVRQSGLSAVLPDPSHCRRRRPQARPPPRPCARRRPGRPGPAARRLSPMLLGRPDPPLPSARPRRPDAAVHVRPGAQEPQRCDRPGSVRRVALAVHERARAERAADGAPDTFDGLRPAWPRWPPPPDPATWLQVRPTDRFFGAHNDTGLVGQEPQTAMLLFMRDLAR